MNVYVITKGDYSDYHIEAVYDDRALANEHVGLYGGEIEDYPLNPIVGEGNKRLFPFVVKIDRHGEAYVESGSVNSAATNDMFMAWNSWDKRFPMGELLAWFAIMAQNETHAIKIANERRTVLVATDRWPMQLDNGELTRTIELE
jgi:hypothetical protein